MASAARASGAHAPAGRARRSPPAGAWSPRRSARRARPTAGRGANALPTEGEIRVVSVSPPMTANTSISSANGTATSAAQPSRASGGAPSVRYSCQRVVKISAPSGIASSSSGWMRREPETSSPGSTIAVSSVPTAWRNVSVTRLASMPGDAEDRRVRRDQRDQQPGGEHDPGRRSRRRSPAATIPGSASRSRSSPESSAACGSSPLRRAVARRARRRRSPAGAARRAPRRLGRRGGACGGRGGAARRRRRGGRRADRRGGPGGARGAASRPARRAASAPGVARRPRVRWRGRRTAQSARGARRGSTAARRAGADRRRRRSEPCRAAVRQPPSAHQWVRSRPRCAQGMLAPSD